MRRITPAEELLQSLGVTDPSEIDLEAIAWILGVKVKYIPLDGCEARIVGLGDSAIITVNTRCSLGRQRYSIGHELGHWKYHKGKTMMCRPADIESFGQKISPAEKHADDYSANLLMPHYLFLPAMRASRRLDFDLIKSLAEGFRVSATAAAIRCIEIGDFPAILISHTQRGRSWFSRSRMVPDRWFPRSELQPESQAINIMFNQKAPPVSRLSYVSAEAWFDRYDAGQYEVMEQTFRISASETLTLLVLDDDMVED